MKGAKLAPRCRDVPQRCSTTRSRDNLEGGGQKVVQDIKEGLEHVHTLKIMHVSLDETGKEVHGS